MKNPSSTQNNNIENNQNTELSETPKKKSNKIISKNSSGYYDINRTFSNNDLENIIKSSSKKQDLNISNNNPNIIDNGNLKRDSSNLLLNFQEQSEASYPNSNVNNKVNYSTESKQELVSVSENTNKNQAQSKSRAIWTFKEDECLQFLVEKYNDDIEKINWTKMAEYMASFYQAKVIPTVRSGKQCRERWFNHLEKEVNKKNWTPEEEKILFEKAKIYGNKWSDIAKFLNKRTDNCIKNHYYSNLRKKIRKLIKTISNKLEIETNFHLKYPFSSLKALEVKNTNPELIYKVTRSTNITYLDIDERKMMQMLCALHQNKMKIEGINIIMNDIVSKDEEQNKPMNNSSANVNVYKNLNTKTSHQTNNSGTINSHFTFDNEKTSGFENDKRKNNIIVLNNKTITENSNSGVVTNISNIDNNANPQYSNNNTLTDNKISTTIAFHPDNSTTIKNYFNIKEEDNNVSYENEKSKIPFFATVVDSTGKAGSKNYIINNNNYTNNNNARNYTNNNRNTQNSNHIITNTNKNLGSNIINNIPSNTINTNIPNNSFSNYNNANNNLGNNYNVPNNSNNINNNLQNNMINRATLIKKSSINSASKSQLNNINNLTNLSNFNNIGNLSTLLGFSNNSNPNYLESFLPNNNEVNMNNFNNFNLSTVPMLNSNNKKTSTSSFNLFNYPTLFNQSSNNNNLNFGVFNNSYINNGIFSANNTDSFNLINFNKPSNNNTSLEININEFIDYDNNNNNNNNINNNNANYNSNKNSSNKLLTQSSLNNHFNNINNKEKNNTSSNFANSVFKSSVNDYDSSNIEQIAKNNIILADNIIRSKSLLESLKASSSHMNNSNKNNSSSIKLSKSIQSDENNYNNDNNNIILNNINILNNMNNKDTISLLKSNLLNKNFNNINMNTIKSFNSNTLKNLTETFQQAGVAQNSIDQNVVLLKLLQNNQLLSNNNTLTSILNGSVNNLNLNSGAFDLNNATKHTHSNSNLDLVKNTFLGNKHSKDKVINTVVHKPSDKSSNSFITYNSNSNTNKNNSDSNSGQKLYKDNKDFSNKKLNNLDDLNETIISPTQFKTKIIQYNNELVTKTNDNDINKERINDKTAKLSAKIKNETPINNKNFKESKIDYKVAIKEVEEDNRLSNTNLPLKENNGFLNSLYCSKNNNNDTNKHSKNSKSLNNKSNALILTESGNLSLRSNHNNEKNKKKIRIIHLFDAFCENYSQIPSMMTTIIKQKLPNINYNVSKKKNRNIDFFDNLINNYEVYNNKTGEFIKNKLDNENFENMSNTEKKNFLLNNINTTNKEKTITFTNNKNKIINETINDNNDFDIEDDCFSQHSQKFNKAFNSNMRESNVNLILENNNSNISNNSFIINTNKNNNNINNESFDKLNLSLLSNLNSKNSGINVDLSKLCSDNTVLEKSNLNNYKQESSYSNVFNDVPLKSIPNINSVNFFNKLYSTQSQILNNKQLSINDIFKAGLYNNLTNTSGYNIDIEMLKKASFLSGSNNNIIFPCNVIQNTILNNFSNNSNITNNNVNNINNSNVSNYSNITNNNSNNSNNENNENNKDSSKKSNYESNSNNQSKCNNELESNNKKEVIRIKTGNNKSDRNSINNSDSNKIINRLRNNSSSSKKLSTETENQEQIIKSSK